MSQQQRTKGRKWQRIRAWVLSESPLCAHCAKEGRVELATEVDHIIPIHKGGGDDFGNLQAICAEHHRDKTASDLGQRVRHGFDADGNPLDPGSPWHR